MTSRQRVMPMVGLGASRWMALGGVIGPVAFVGAWATGAVLTSVEYSVATDAISRLAAVGSDVRWLMTAGFIIFGVGLMAFATALRCRLDGWAWAAAGATGAIALVVAAAPLDRSDNVSTLHGIAAAAGYVALVATPLLAARPLRRCGHELLALSGSVCGALAIVALAISAAPAPTGLFQRTGLTLVDAWIVATSVVILRGAEFDRPAP